MLGRSLRGRPGAGRARLRCRPGGSCSSATASRAGRSATTSSARRCATRSTRATKACCPRAVWGDGEPEGVRARAARGDEGHGPRGRRARRRGRHGFTGSAIWHMLYSFPPNDFADDRARLRGVRRALEPDHRRLRAQRACASRSRCTRPRSPTTSSRRAAALEAIGDRAGLRHQLRPEPLRARSSSTRPPSSHEFADRIYHVHVKDSRPRASTGAASILGAPPGLRRPAARLGLRLARATATSTSSASSGR